MRKKLTLIIVVGFIVLALAGAVAWLFYSGKLVWAGNGAQSQAKVVCGTDTVESFNKARELTYADNEIEPKIDEDGQKRIGDQVKTMDGFEDDPTCQTILLWVAYLNNDYDGAKNALSSISRLHENRLYADTNLSGVEAISTYTLLVEGLSPENANKGRNGDE